MRVVRRRTGHTVYMTHREFDALRIATDIGMQCMRTARQRQEYADEQTGKVLARWRFQAPGGPLSKIDETVPGA